MKKKNLKVEKKLKILEIFKIFKISKIMNYDRFVVLLMTCTGHVFQSKLQYVTVMGAGLLVGTALAVIIPEGVNTIIQSRPKGEHQALPCLKLRQRFRHKSCSANDTCYFHQSIAGSGSVLISLSSGLTGTVPA